MCKGDFLNFIQGTGIFEQMARLFVNRGLKSWSLMNTHHVFGTLNPAQRTELQSFMDLVPFDAGDTLEKKGKDPCQGYLISKGKLEVRQGSKVLKVFKSGDFIADIESIAELQNSPYTIKSLTKGKAYVLGHKPFQRFLRAYPGVYLRLLHSRNGQ